MIVFFLLLFIEYTSTAALAANNNTIHAGQQVPHTILYRQVGYINFYMRCTAANHSAAQHTQQVIANMKPKICGTHTKQQEATNLNAGACGWLARCKTTKCLVLRRMVRYLQKVSPGSRERSKPVRAIVYICADGHIPGRLYDMAECCFFSLSLDLFFFLIYFCFGHRAGVWLVCAL